LLLKQMHLIGYIQNECYKKIKIWKYWHIDLWNGMLHIVTPGFFCYNLSHACVVLGWDQIQWSRTCN
jgi:hypothetical protein